MFDKTLNNNENFENISNRLFNFSQLTIFILLLSIIIATILSDSLLAEIIIFIILLFFSMYLNEFNNFIIKTLNRFKIFIVLILLISYLNNFSTDNLAFDFFKVYNLLILSIIFNFLIDIDLLMNYLDFKMNNFKPKALKISIRKVTYSFLLGVKFIPELFTFGNNIREVMEIRGYSAKKDIISRVKSYKNFLMPMFITSFIKAQSLEKSLILKGFTFDRDRTLFKSFELRKRDFYGFLSSIIIISLSLLF